MLLPLRGSHPLDPPARPLGEDAPMRLRDCTGAAFLFAVVMVTALLLLGLDWDMMLDGDRSLPEASRTLIMAPLPR
ncbi:hypothetical protein SAMN02982994_5104 [Azospirillum lipoferum]|nr:hypothetical protein SAMN02982994_5104 [Azospirillum lipoferum]